MRDMTTREKSLAPRLGQLPTSQKQAVITLLEKKEKDRKFPDFLFH